MARLSPLVYGGLLPDGNVNQKLVMQGWCWWYRKYVPGDTVLEGVENDAREERKGLWADPQPMCRRGSGGRGAGELPMTCSPLNQPC